MTHHRWAVIFETLKVAYAIVMAPSQPRNLPRPAFSVLRPGRSAGLLELSAAVWNLIDSVCSTNRAVTLQRAILSRETSQANCHPAIG